MTLSGAFSRPRGSASKKTVYATEQLRPDVARKRRRWRQFQAGLDPHKLVFIDETWVKTNMAPLRGWGPKGARLLGRAPHGKWRTLTFIAALRASGLGAPCVFNSPINGETFRAWMAQMLVRELAPGDIVVMDNLGSHKGVETRRMIRSAGARLWFLPPYSPDLNPIEQTFSKIKHAMRTAQERTVEDVIQRTGEIITTISPKECNNYIVNAGYASAET